MSVFKDKVYESMDWVSQAVEPFISKSDDIVATVPDLIEVSNRTFAKAIMSGGTSISLGEVLIDQMSVSEFIGGHLPYSERSAFFKSFKFELNGDEPYFDVTSGTIKNGSFTVRKVSSRMEDKDYLQLYKELLRRSLPVARNAKTKATTELGKIFFENDKEYIKKDKKRRLYAIISFLEGNPFNIKSVEAWKSFVADVTDYLQTEDLVALGKILRITIMAGQGTPIYGVQK